MKHVNSTRSVPRLITAGLIAAAFQCTTAMAQPGMADVSVPADIEVPAGNRAFLKAHAVGTQNYICLPSGWTFLGPQATLFVTYRWLNSDIQHQIATHFLSANPFEGGTPRPTWQSSLDTSVVWAKSTASSSDPKFVAQGAIPWLRLEVVGAQRGPGGGSILSQATYLQRVNTAGGVMPANACNVGSTALVPYTADYIFYKAGK